MAPAKCGLCRRRKAIGEMRRRLSPGRFLICRPCLTERGASFPAHYFRAFKSSPKEKERDYRGPLSLRPTIGKRPKGTSATPPWKPRPKPRITARQAGKEVFDFRRRRVQHHRDRWQPYGLFEPDGSPVQGPILVKVARKGGRGKVVQRAVERAVHNMNVVEFAQGPCTCRFVNRDGVVSVAKGGCKRHRRLKLF